MLYWRAVLVAALVVSIATRNILVTPTTMWVSVAPGILNERTPVGVLGTVGAWHHRAPGYDLGHLEALVRGFAPDLLCAEINRGNWEIGRLDMLPPEYPQCLLPLCRELGIIVIPVGDQWRGLPSPLRLTLALGAGPRWVNSAVTDWWHRAWAWLFSGSRQADCKLVAYILEAVRRDPGRRVLVTVRVERRYAVMTGLRRADGVTLVPVGPPPA